MKGHTLLALSISVVMAPVAVTKTVALVAGVSVIDSIAFSMETATPSAMESDKFVSAGAARIFDKEKKERYRGAYLDTGTRKISGSV